MRILASVLLSCMLVSCSGRDRTTDMQEVVVAVEGDVDTFNPLFAEEITAGEINDLLFPGLVGSDFDETTGKLEYTPLLARSWEFINDGRGVLFHLVTGSLWSDGKPVTARDVQHSYILYADHEVGSIRQSAVSELRRTAGHLDVARSVEVWNDSTVIFHFEHPYPGQLFDAGLPILPAHVFTPIAPAELRTHAINRIPVSSGPFLLASWQPMQEVILTTNPACRIPAPARLQRLVFKVVTDYRSRVQQLKSGEVDIVSGLRPEDAGQLDAEAPHIRVISTAGRDYDFIGWNNIDPDAYTSNKAVIPHRLFGSATVRRALTMAIDRQELTSAYLGDHGQVAFGGVSPLFRWAYHDSLAATGGLPFDRRRAQALLEQEGWRPGNDGVRARNGVRFEFTLKVPAGNQLRSVVATAVQQYLKDVGVRMKIEMVERGTFWGEVMERKYDAWLAGFSVPLQMQLEDLWRSDLEAYPFNLTGFRNSRVDTILAATRRLADETAGRSLWREFQLIVHHEQPCTFLFWINNIVGMNTRVGGTDIGVLGTTHRAWEWHVNGRGPKAIAAR